MSDPEAIYAALTSGSPATIAAVDEDVVSTMRAISDSIALIRYAEDKPSWASPTARTRFNMRAWATRAAAEIGYIRLNRASLALQRVESHYRKVIEHADTVIGLWRRYSGQIEDPVTLHLFRRSIVSALEMLRRTYDDSLHESLDFVVSDPLTEQQEQWYEQGLAKSMVDDLQSPGSQGPMIPESLLTGDDDDGWKAQGLGYDPASGLLLQTAYNGDRSQLSLVDPATGELVQTVDLGNIEGLDHPPDHAGGVVVHDGTVWVTSSDQDNPSLVPYSLDDVRSATPGSPVPTLGPASPIAAGSYATVSGNTLYVGDFERDRIYTYTWDRHTGTWSDKQGPFPTPNQTQGVAVRGNEIVFSTSYGRGNGSALHSYNLHDVVGGGALGDPIRTVDLPNMSEGVAALPHGLLTTYESGASGYSEPTDEAPLASLWAAMNMTVTPYSELGMAGSIDVEPVTLVEASKHFAEVQDGLEAAESSLRGVSLPASALGEVPNGPLFAAGLNAHLQTTATWLDEGKLSAGVTASGLVSSAEEYAQSDQGARGFFDRLLSLVG